MANRLLFPADRTAFQYTEPGQPILVPPVSAITVYADKQCTVLADIRRLDGAVIANSTIYTDTAGLLPEFFGPNSADTRLWALPLVQGRDVQSYPLDANYGIRIDALAAQVESIPIPGGEEGDLANTVLHGDHPPTGLDGIDGDFYIDDDAWVIYGPKAGAIWPAGVSLVGPPGAPGTEAEAGAYTHAQFFPETIWEIAHPLSFIPSVTVVDSAGSVVFGDVQVLSPSRIQVRFSAPFSGSAFLS